MYKKILKITIISFCIFTMVGCGSSKATNEKQSSTEETESVDIIKEIEERGYITSEDVEKLSVVSHDVIYPEALYLYMGNLENYSEHCGNAVIGTIKDLEYGVNGNIEWTRIYVEVEEDLKGNLKPGTVITVGEMGGYLTYNQFIKHYSCEPEGVDENQLIELLYYCDKPHEKGDKGLFFIKEDDRKIFGCDYGLIGDDLSFYEYEETDEKYIEKPQVKNAETNYYSYEEIKKCVENTVSE